MVVEEQALAMGAVMVDLTGLADFKDGNSLETMGVATPEKGALAVALPYSGHVLVM